MLGSTKSQNMSLDACYGSNHSAIWPADVYVHLFIGDPTSGSPELVVGTGGYAPIETVNTSTNWPDAVGGQKTNGATFAFPTSTAAWSGVPTYFWLTDAATSLVAPQNPTITVVGTTGSTNWQYVVTARNSAGQTTASGVGGTTVGNATLTATNHNALSWGAVTGATTGYDIYRRKLTSLSNTTAFLLIASGVSTTTYDDEGAAASTVSPPSSNSTMNLLDGGPLTVPIKVPAAGYRVNFPPGAIVIATS